MKNITTGLLILLLLAVSSCATPSAKLAPAPAPGPSPAPRPEKYIKVEQTVDKDAYLPGEEVVIKLSFQNVNTEPLELAHFPPVAVEILEKPQLGELIRTLPPGEDIRVLEPGETIAHTLIWDQRDDQGELVDPGRYNINLMYLYLDERPPGVSVMMSGQGLTILPPGGVVEKTFEVNESRTVGGITFTLERVELTASVNTVYAFSTPRPPDPLPKPFKGAVAEYSIDDGAKKEAGFSDGEGLSRVVRVEEDGVRHTWYLLGFIPKGTKELTFIITSFGDVPGPWEFRVSLE